MTTKPRGAALLRDPHMNRSGAFSEAEREKLGLLGLVPEAIENEEIQIQRVLLQLEGQPSNLDKYVYLSKLQDTNETLFYRLLMSDPGDSCHWFIRQQ